MALSDVDAYHFEFRFRLPDDKKIWSEESEITIGSVLGNDCLSLRARNGGKMREAVRLSLFGFGYATMEQAHEAAERARRALVFAAIESNTAIKWRHRLPGQPGGLSVWQGHRATDEIEVSDSAFATVGVNADTFRERLSSQLVNNIQLTNN